MAGGPRGVSCCQPADKQLTPERASVSHTQPHHALCPDEQEICAQTGLFGHVPSSKHLDSVHILRGQLVPTYAPLRPALFRCGTGTVQKANTLKLPVPLSADVIPGAGAKVLGKRHPRHFELHPKHNSPHRICTVLAQGIQRSGLSQGRTGVFVAGLGEWPRAQ